MEDGIRLFRVNREAEVISREAAVRHAELQAPSDQRVFLFRQAGGVTQQNPGTHQSSATYLRLKLTNLDPKP